MSVTEQKQEAADAVRIGWFEEAEMVSGEGEVDRLKLKQSIAGTLVSQGVVKNRKERGSKSIAQGTLMRLVFPHVMPDDDSYSEASEIEQLAYKDLLREVWGEVNPYTQSPTSVQSLVGEAGDYVLVRTEIAVEGLPQKVVYVTKDGDLIMADFGQVLEERCVSAANKLAKNMAMVTMRQPALAARSKRAVGNGMRAATGTAKATYELLAGHQGGEGDDGADA